MEDGEDGVECVVHFLLLLLGVHRADKAIVIELFVRTDQGKRLEDKVRQLLFDYSLLHCGPSRRRKAALYRVRWDGLYSKRAWTGKK